MRRRFKKLFVWILFLFTLLLGTELIIRHNQHYHLWPPKLEKSSYFEMDKLKVWNAMFVEDRKNYFRDWPIQLETFPDSDIYPRYLFKPNLKMTTSRGKYIPAKTGDKIQWSSNSFGFRGKEIDLYKPSGTLRLVALGASTTEGSQSDEETYPAYLEKLFISKGYPVEVVNAGHHGFGIDDLVTLYTERIVPLQPDYLIFYEVANNINASEWLRENIPIGSFETGTPHWFAQAYRYSATVRFITHITGIEKRRPPLFKHTFLLDSPKPTLDKYLNSVKHLITQARNHKTQLILTTFVTILNGKIEVDPSSQPNLFYDMFYKWYPLTPDEVSEMYAGYNTSLKRLSEEEGVPLIDLAAIYPGENRFFVDHIHFTPEGNQHLALLIASYLENMGLIKKPETL